VSNFLFSIIIPSYNRETFVSKAINSILNQDFLNYEIIVINDGSTDATVESLKQFNNKIKIINLGKNYGPGYARNRGIEVATGEWLCFLDSDDFFFYQKLREIAKIKDVKKHNCIVHNNFLVELKKNNIKKVKNGTFSFFLKQTMTHCNSVISLSSSIVKKSFLNENNIHFNENKKFTGNEDFLFWLDIIYQDNKVYFYNKYLSTINIGDDNLTNYKKKNITDIKKNLKVLFFFHKKKGLRFNFKDVLISKIFLFYLKNGNYLAVYKIFLNYKIRIIKKVSHILFLKLVLFLYRLN
jgi:glycosyltransferase involved in cell wall biosynthesis